MTQLSVEFSYSPLWFLLIIPAAALAIFLFFRVRKKNRKNRNRIASLCLHMVIIVLAAFVMVGMTFHSTTIQEATEIMIVVDVSDSTVHTTTEKETFINHILDESDGAHYIGIVIFGRDAHLVIAPTRMHGAIMPAFRNAQRPDSRATNIAGALNLAFSSFNDPADGRIILLSDGIQTDGNALAAAENIARAGTRIDTVLFPLTPTDPREVGIVGVNIVNPGTVIGQRIDFDVQIQALSRIPAGSYGARLLMEVFTPNRGHIYTPIQTIAPEILPGRENFIRVGFTPTSSELHIFRFHYTRDGDVVSENNIFYTFVYIGGDQSILILEGSPGEATMFADFLRPSYHISVLPIADAPTDVAGLQRYDQVILMNVSPTQFPAGFEPVLDFFVRELGGGMLTTGGYNAHRVEDFAGDDVGLFEDLLPVEASNISVPMGLAMIIDTTTSMVRPEGALNAGMVTPITPNPGTSFPAGISGTNFTAWQGTSFPAMISDPNNPGVLIRNPYFGIAGRALGNVMPHANAAWGSVGGTFDQIGGMRPNGFPMNPTRLDLALEGAYYATRALNDSDFVMATHFHGTTASGAGTVRPIIPYFVPVAGDNRYDMIHQLRQPVYVNSTAVMWPSIQNARDRFVVDLPNVDIRHIMILVDTGEVGQWGTGPHMNTMANWAQHDNISYSFILIGDGGTADLTEIYRLMGAVHDVGGFFSYAHVNRDNQHLIPDIMYQKVRTRALEHTNIVPAFTPSVNNISPVLGASDPTGIWFRDPLDEDVITSRVPNITGYFGTRARATSRVVLNRRFVGGHNELLDGGADPIYAYWERGNGWVGSLTTDLRGGPGSFTQSFFEPAGEVGRRLLLNIVNSLMPSESLRQRDIIINTNSHNIRTEFTINAHQMEETGHTLDVRLVNPDGIATMLTSQDTPTFSGQFDMHVPGIYTIHAVVSDASGLTVHEVSQWVAFSYSLEVAMFWTAAEAYAFMNSITVAQRPDGQGGIIGEGAMFLHDVFADPVFRIFDPSLMAVTTSFDPRIIFLSVLIGLFLLDIIARKFKFKWPHEIIRDAKAKKAEKAVATGK